MVSITFRYVFDAYIYIHICVYKRRLMELISTLAIIILLEYFAIVWELCVCNNSIDVICQKPYITKMLCEIIMLWGTFWQVEKACGNHQVIQNWDMLLLFKIPLIFFVHYIFLTNIFVCVFLGNHRE